MKVGEKVAIYSLASLAGRSHGQRTVPGAFDPQRFALAICRGGAWLASLADRLSRQKFSKHRWHLRSNKLDKVSWISIGVLAVSVVALFILVGTIM